MSLVDRNEFFAHPGSGGKNSMMGPPLPDRSPLYGGLDMERPKLGNSDGSFSTERTITIDAQTPNGVVRWYNIPTIVGGKRLSEDEATDLFFKGQNPPVGDFESLDRALEAARSRSDAIGNLRK